MSVVMSAPPAMVRLHRAPLLDPPFDDELSAITYRPEPSDDRLIIPPGALAGATPDAQAAAMRFLNFCLELLNGFRTPAQLRPLIEPDWAGPITEELLRATQLAIDLRRRSNDSKVRRNTIRVCEPKPGAAEASAVLSNANRSFALMFRIEKRTPTWKCAYLKLLL